MHAYGFDPYDDRPCRLVVNEHERVGEPAADRRVEPELADVVPVRRDINESFWLVVTKGKAAALNKIGKPPGIGGSGETLST